MALRGRIFLSLFAFLLILCGCQLLSTPKHQEGLTKDSRSYSYLGYHDNKIRVAARNVKGVKRVTTDYDGRRILVRVYLDRSIPYHAYRKKEKELREMINAAAPLSPIHIILKPIDSRKPKPVHY